MVGSRGMSARIPIDACVLNATHLVCSLEHEVTEATKSEPVTLFGNLVQLGQGHQAVGICKGRQ